MIGLLNTVETTNNFWDAFLLRLLKTRRTMKFRNGVQIEAGYCQYATLRDWFDFLRKNSFTIAKTKHGYIIKKDLPDLEFSFQTQDILTAKPFFDFLLSLTLCGWTVKRIGFTYEVWNTHSKYLIEQIGEDLFHIKSNELELVGSNETMNVCLYECEAGLYEADYHNKTVLDIGGFTGETAAFFASKGAKKIIVYEPVFAHHALIKKNLMLNHVDAEIHDEGIGETDGTRIVRYNSFGVGFGLSFKGRNQISIKIRKASDVILQSKADIAKIDCEGGETSLLNVSTDILRSIDFYFVETHSLKIEKAIFNKFCTAGFVMPREPVRFPPNIAMLYFKKTELPAIEKCCS
jgi:FkbM family methyltransferase